MNDSVIISKSTVLSALLWKVLERFFSQGLNLVIQIVLARILLPEDFGSIAIIAAIIAYASIFVQAGMGTALMQKKDLVECDVNTLFTGSLIIALLIYGLIFVFSPSIAGLYDMTELIWPLRVLSLTLFLGAINSIQSAIFARQMRFKALFFRSLLAVPISGLVGIVLALKGYGLWALIMQSIVNYLVVIIYMSLDKNIKIRFGFSKDSARVLYSFSGKILLSGLVSGFSDTCRTMVIGKQYSTRELAYYDKAYSYSSLVVQAIITSISSVLLPAFSRSQEDLNRLLSMVRKSVRMSAFTMFPVLMCLCASSKSFILLLLTDKWAASIPFFMLFCIFRMSGLISTSDKQMYFAMGNSTIAFYYEIGLLIAQVSMLLITVPISVAAIAVGAFIVELLGNCVLFTISSIKYGYSWRDRIADIYKPLINSSIAAIIVYIISFLNISLLLVFIIQIITSFTVYYLLSTITHDNSLIEIKEIIKDKFESVKNKQV